METENEIYTTTIIIHPRVVQLQRVLTLDDYLQIQALLEYFQRRQAFIHENQHAQLRLERALNNIRLLKLQHRRQRAAQVQRLLQQYHEQCYQFDRAKLICALEQHRAQLAFRHYLEQQQQEKEVDDDEKEVIKNNNQLPEVKQLNELVTPSESSIPIDNQIDNNVQEEPLAVQPNIDTQNIEEKDDEDEDEDEDYKKYQSQQLEDLLKLLFEKHQQQEELNQQQASFLPPQFEKKENEDVYEPLYRQTGPIRSFNEPPIFQRQTAPIGSFNERQEEQNKGIETSSNLKHDSDLNQPQPIPLSENIKEEEKENNNKPLLPDHVTSLEDVLNRLVHSSTPVPPEEKEKEMKIKETNQPPPPPPPSQQQRQYKPVVVEEDEKEDKEVTEKLNQLKQIENRVEKLYNDHHEKAIQIPLQYQVNEQGKLFLDGNTPDNRLFLGYEDDIVKCMLQLDNILSDGNINIRNQRRKIIQRAESILEQLDHHKQQEWEKETRKQNATTNTSGGKKHRHRKRKHHVPIKA
ncbi:unnamed protein product [Cunninghamella blakesleeana]